MRNYVSCAGTRADKLRSLLHNLIHGGDALPVDQLRDLHQALVKGSNLYHPVDLAAQLEASAVDVSTDPYTHTHTHTRVHV